MEKIIRDRFKNDSSNSTNNSTLSLHISYENSNEALSLNINFQKLWLNQRQKQINPALAFVSQNPFEFQRQKNDKVPEPEVSQFKASQQLINPALIKMLQTLSFSNEASKRWDTVEDGKRVAAKILETKRIHTLDLSGNTLGVQASGPIAEALKKHPELKIAQWKDLFTTRLNTEIPVVLIAQWKDLFTTRLNTEIPVVLKSFTDAMVFAGTRLTTLDLSDNAIGPQAIHGLQDFLSSEACFGLKNLYLNN
uniref:Uncharacterized protein n=1 Tax=Panagrolaimus sp. PS1159 TaxID=55785 RepID=A0AC35F0T2_9BILA